MGAKAMALKSPNFTKSSCCLCSLKSQSRSLKRFALFPLIQAYQRILVRQATRHLESISLRREGPRSVANGSVTHCPGEIHFVGRFAGQ